MLGNTIERDKGKHMKTLSENIWRKI